MPQNRQKTGFRGPSPDVGKATQFKPGTSPNPGGRPKRDAAAEFALSVLECVLESEDVKKAAKSVATQLRKGNAKPFAVLADRAYGKATQPVAVSGGDKPLVIRVVSTLPDPVTQDVGQRS